MASARMKNGKWYYRITITVGDGSHKWIERGGYRTKKEALDAGNKVEVSYKEGGSIDRQKNISFNFLQQEWRQYAESELKENSIKLYIRHIDSYINPVLKDYSIKAVKPTDCQIIIDKMAARGLARSRLLLTRSTMRSVFQYAVRQGYIQKNPVKEVYLPEPRSNMAKRLKAKRVARTLPKEEIEAIFTRWPEGTPAYIPMLLGYKCGLRVSEAFGLLVEDVDLKNKVLHIRRQVQLDRDGRTYFTEPKYCNPGEGRDVYMDVETCAVLKRQIDKISANYIPCKYPVYYIDKEGFLNFKSGRVVVPINLRMNTGALINEFSIYNVVSTVHGKIGHFDYIDPQFHFHELRHTHASECIAAGMPLVSVQKRLGHKNLATTMKVYVHETETQVTESQDIIEKMFE